MKKTDHDEHRAHPETQPRPTAEADEGEPGELENRRRDRERRRTITQIVTGRDRQS
jgi:hypothetical protein